MDRRSSTDENPTQYRPSIASAAWRHRWLVLLSVIVALAVGLWWTARQPIEYQAAAQLIVDPSATVVSEGATVSPDRYIAVQVVVLRSERLAELAAETAQNRAGTDESDLPTPPDFLINTEVITPEGTDLIEIRFTGFSPRKAVLGANSLAVAYQDLRRSEAIANATAAIERVDALIENAQSDLESIQREIDSIGTGRTGESFPIIDSLELQLADSLQLLLELQEQLRQSADEEQAQLIRQQIDDIAQQISMLQSLRSLGQGDPDLEALLQQRQAALERRAQLSERRDVLEVDAELVSSGVASFLPAESAIALGSSDLLRTAAVMVVFGAMVGSAIAYLLASRRQGFTYRHAPAGILGAPLLADIPDFSEERIDGMLPVRTSPHSVAAEAFRFALAALDLRMGTIIGAKSAVVASGAIGTGKTVFTANLALAAVRSGYRVLAVDADFGNQALTALLTDDEDPSTGLTEAINVDGAELDRFIQEIPWFGGNLYLLSRGRGETNAVDFFRSEASYALFEELKHRFDLVLIDSPSMLQVAYGALLARHADSVIAIVSHDGDIAETAEFSSRLDFVGKPIVGYIYNQAPLRPEMTLSEGSLRELRQNSVDTRGRGRHG